MMMATNYSNKQDLENHWLTSTIWFCQLQGPWPGPTLCCFLPPGSCIHLSQTLKLGIFYIKVQIPGFSGRMAIWWQQLFSGNVSWGTHSPFSEALPDPVGWELAFPTSVGLLPANTWRLLWPSLEGSTGT